MMQRATDPDVLLPGASAAVVLVCLVSFASGASALIFEILWFHEAGLVFGNSVWATSMTLSSFMGGLALGNGLAGHSGHRMKRSIRCYAVVEIVIAAAGIGLTYAFPAVTAALIFLFRPFLDEPLVLNPLRFLIAFVLMLVPTTAMGATLPLLVTTLCASDSRFGRVLGRIYGWNTLGAVAGAMACEIVLITSLGIKGAALAAGVLNLTAAVAMLLFAREREKAGVAAFETPFSDPALPLSLAGWRLLAAAFLSGGILLALEVVWFRFMTLFVISTGLAFTFMLAVILAGIGVGALIAGFLLGIHPAMSRFAGVVALACGILCIANYVAFQIGLPNALWTLEWNVILKTSLRLMFPTSLLSGMLFTWLGDAANREIGNETRTTGLLTLANTTGAMAGAFVGGFVLLPGLGMERSLFLLAAGYGAVALCVGAPAAGGNPARRAPIWYGGLAVFAIALGFFPFGLMNSRYVQNPAGKYTGDGAAIVEGREGLTETIHYMRKDFLGAPLYHRLVANGFSMSATVGSSNRYMKLFTYWPVAVHPGLHSVLLIGYGVGSTAKSLTDTRSIGTIDIVDTSRDVLEMNRLVYPDPTDHPLSDPRVKVHVEDGRYFLLSTSRTFDLITGEPPPPRIARAVSLYTREYFQLVHDRLAEHGITTHWLPVHQLLRSDALAIVRSFCDVFDDCSLWGGSAYDWMLVGTRNAAGPVSEEQFAKQWQDPVTGPALRELGVEVPEQLGALFLADAPALKRAAADTPPLLDDYPNRLTPALSTLRDDRFRFFLPWMDVQKARAAFEESAIVSRLWPPALRQRSLEWFAVQGTINHGLAAQPNVITNALFGMAPPLEDVNVLDRVLTRTTLRTLPMWLLGSSAQHQRIVDQRVREGRSDAAIDYHLGIRAMADRNYEAAAEHFRAAQEQRPADVQVALRHIYALCLAGRGDAAQAVADSFPERARLVGLRGYWAFVALRFHMSKPGGGPSAP
jgi:spermidine synthase